MMPVGMQQQNTPLRGEQSTSEVLLLNHFKQPACAARLVKGPIQSQHTLYPHITACTISPHYGHIYCTYPTPHPQSPTWLHSHILLTGLFLSWKVVVTLYASVVACMFLISGLSWLPGMGWGGQGMLWSTSS